MRVAPDRAGGEQDVEAPAGAEVQDALAFVIYRIVIGLLLFGLLAAGVLNA
ncbi:hypothetical protein [Streptomyces lydicus]|uniref:hypothetical protein n=1 Tax=Streptomyces lydicus TaxID=47763 RepID=UPI0036F79DA5